MSKASAEQCKEALRKLSQHSARRHHGERVVILIDEYDTPLHEAFVRGYYDEAVSFFRGLLSGALKDNEHLFKGVLTGILRIARESLFSGLNNLGVYSLLKQDYATDFGFTEAEVQDLRDRLRSPVADGGPAALVQRLRLRRPGHLQSLVAAQRAGQAP